MGIHKRSLSSRILRSSYNNIIIFMILMLYKLVLFHYSLHIHNIDMNPLDYVITIGSLLLVSFWTFGLPRRGQSISLIILNILLTAILYSDLVYYRYFQDFITIPVLFQTGQVSSLGESIRSLLFFSDLFFFIDWILFIPYVIITFMKRRQTQYSMYSTSFATTSRVSGTIRGRAMKGVLTFVLGFVLTFGPIKFYSETWAKGLFEGNWWNMALYNVTGLIGFHGYDIYRYSKEYLGPEPTLPEEEITKVKEWFDQRNTNPTTTNQLFGKYKDSNVIVIQVEAFMNFMIGQSINGQEITPNFNKLMNESMYFSNYYHQTGQGRTSDADFSSHSALHPLPSGSVFVRYPDHKYDILPAILQEKGYATNAFHAYDSSFWNRYTMYKAMGYDRFYSKKDFTMDESLGWSLGDKSFFKQSLDDMQEIKQPFYSFLITLSSHHPYVIPKGKQELDVGEFTGNIFGDYLQSIHYVDSALGQFVEQMKDQGLWDNTILYVYGDHDNSIKEKEYYEQFLGRGLNDLDMRQIMNQVPLLVHLPDGSEAGTYPDVAGQLDMMPSILHLLGIDTTSYHIMGNNLFNGQERSVTLRTGDHTDSNVYYIPSADGVFDNGSCYDLRTRQMTKVGSCRAGFDQGKQELHISDQVIQYDLIRKFDQE
ncbi:LTA synthase family protein [Paenibacillus sp. IHBB 10380]|uniref:LTA synthase family protein n=1 Tax=Paenibacillus sp. IHBB 10380 TaxID=1566358 RepID=UPI0009E2FB52|nr:LTA synthase family protein [Paenibacillus sp. IHBB 10380]